MIQKEDRERLLKFLELMSSDQDGEALNASRMATKLMKKLNLRWGDLIAENREIRPNLSHTHGFGGVHPSAYNNQQYNPYANAFNQAQQNSATYDKMREQMENLDRIIREQAREKEKVMAAEAKKRSFFKEYFKGSSNG